MLRGQTDHPGEPELLGLLCIDRRTREGTTMPDDAVTTQQAAINAVLDAYDQSVQASKAVVALRDRPDPSTTDLAHAYTTWRGTVQHACEAARDLPARQSTSPRP